MGQANFAKSWKMFIYLTQFILKSPVTGSRTQAGWPEAWADWGKLGNQKIQKIQKYENWRSLPIWAKPKRNLLILPNLVRSFRCQAPEVKLAGQKPGLTGESSEIKKSTKSKNPKTGRSLLIGLNSVRTLRCDAPHSSSSSPSFP